jgi:branched-chain amino acid transport system substrate-binding protein
MRPKWLRTVTVLAALAVVASACGDDDDDDTATATSGAATTGAAATTAGGSTDTTGAATETTAAAASDNPKVGDAKDADDYLARLAQLLPETLKYTDPVAEVSGSTTQGVTDTTIKVGSVTAMTTPQGVEPFAGICEGMMARLEVENAKGGVKAQDGKTRKFEFAGTKDEKGRVCQDDKLDRDLNRQKIKDMVEGDKVFALLPVTSNGFFSGDYLNDKHIPYFGFGFQIDYCGAEKPFAFGVGGAVSCDKLGDHTFASTTLSKPLFEALGVDPTTQKVALAGSSDPSSTTGNKVVQAGFEAVGAQVVTVDNSLPAPGSPLPTDFSPYVSKMLENDPDVVVLVISYDQVEPMAKALKDAGFKGAIQQFVYETDLLTFAAANFPGIDGSYVGNPGIGAPKGDTERLDEIRAGLDAIGFQATPLSTNVLYGWGSADMLVTMIQEAPGPLTTENIANYVNKGWGYKGFGEAVCPSSWPLQHYIGSPCFHVVQLDLSGSLGGTNALGANGGKGGMIPKVTISFNDLFIIEKPK